MLEPSGSTVSELLTDADTDACHSCCDGYERKTPKTSAFSGATRQSDTHEHAYASGKEWSEDNNIKLLVADKKREQSVNWTREEEQALLNLQDSTSTCRAEWDTIAKHPALAGRTVIQIKSKWKNMSARQQLNTNQSTITTQHESKSRHRRPRRNWWTKEEEQPLLDLLTQNTLGRMIDWDVIAQYPALVDRTVEQVKHKWKHLKRRGPTLRGTSSALWSPEEDDRLLELCERITEAESVSGKLKLLAKAFPGRAQTAVQTRYYVLMRKHAEEESNKNVLAVNVHDDTLTTKCNTTNATAAVDHTEENAQQLDIKRLSKSLLKHSERDRSCGDDGLCVGTDASDPHADTLNRAADNDNTLRLAKKRRLHMMMDHPQHSSSHNVAPTVVIAEAGSSTSTSIFKRISNQQTPQHQGVVKPEPTSRMASTCDTHQHNSSWASLCPILNAEKVNGIISNSWHLFDDCNKWEQSSTNEAKSLPVLCSNQHT
jgi:hypothetical protein